MIKAIDGEKGPWAKALSNSLTVHCSVLFYVTFLDVNSTFKQMAPQLESFIVFLTFIFLFFKLPSTGHPECFKIQHTSFTKTILISPKTCLYSLVSLRISEISTITPTVS